jgi:hypothetical protein
MAIQFLYKRRESLTGRSEAYKKSVRAYLESEGYSQTTDSYIEGTLEDMVFHNPTVAPGKRFVVEVKAEALSLHSCKFAIELVRYFRMWQSEDENNKSNFVLFAQALKEPEQWELIFGRLNDRDEVENWCTWYEDKCREDNETELIEKDIKDIGKFMAGSRVVVANSVELDTAVSEKQLKSALSISRMAKTLFEQVNKRKSPIMRKSTLIMNILPVTVPSHYYLVQSSAASKQEIYEGLKDKLIPPFIWSRNREIMTFSPFDESNPLRGYVSGDAKSMLTESLQLANPPLCSNLINIHLRRILWNKGIWRDSEFFYYPLLDTVRSERSVEGQNKQKTVVKKYEHTKDTAFAKKGDVNFYFHHAVEIGTPTYWGTSYIELIPRRYYTLDGQTPIDGEIRAKIDSHFRNPNFDRNSNRLSLMRFWKFVLQSKEYEIPAENWFDEFKFGEFISMKVDWSPEAIGRKQTTWELWGEK